MDEWEAAFQHEQAGAALKRGLVSYDEAATLDELARMRQLSTSISCRDWAGAVTIRSRRSSSSACRAAAAPWWSRFSPVTRASADLAKADAFARAVNAVEAGRPELGRAPVAIGSASGSDRLMPGILRQSAPAGARGVDKMLDNFRHLGLIVLSLPRAKIIHIRRNAVETCLSCYSKLFNAGVAYSYDLGEFGRYYRAHERLMDHWRAILPEEYLLTVDYEAIVSDLEGESRRIAGFLRRRMGRPLPGVPQDRKAGAHRQQIAGSPTLVRRFASARSRAWRRISSPCWRRFAAADLGRAQGGKKPRDLLFELIALAREPR